MTLEQLKDECKYFNDFDESETQSAVLIRKLDGLRSPHVDLAKFMKAEAEAKRRLPASVPAEGDPILIMMKALAICQMFMLTKFLELYSEYNLTVPVLNQKGSPKISLGQGAASSDWSMPVLNTLFVEFNQQLFTELHKYFPHRVIFSMNF